EDAPARLPEQTLIHNRGRACWTSFRPASITWPRNRCRSFSLASPFRRASPARLMLGAPSESFPERLNNSHRVRATRLLPWRWALDAFPSLRNSSRIACIHLTFRDTLIYLMTLVANPAGTWDAGDHASRGPSAPGVRPIDGGRRFAISIISHVHRLLS